MKYDYMVTITGASGFVGSHLARRFLEDPKRDVMVYGADREVTHRTAQLMLEFPDNFWFEEYDVHQPLHSDLLAVDSLYHFAGIANPQTYLDDPWRVMDLNLMGLHNILDRVQRWTRGRPRIVFSSTSEVYGKSAAIPFHEDETDLVFGPTQARRWCYAMSKAVCEHYIQSQSFAPYTVFRFFNFVGTDVDAPGAGRVITRMVGDSLANGAIQVVGDGRQTRCFTWQDDFVEALVLPTYLKKERNGWRDTNQVVNLGSDEETSMKDLALKIAVLLETPEIRFVPAAQFYGEGYEDVMRRVPSVQKAIDIFGWRATTPLDEFLPKIVSATVDAWNMKQPGGVAR